MPKGGTRAVAEGLANLAASLGADLRPGVEVSGFDIENDTVRAVRTAGGERIACDAVISNMDAIRTYTELVGGPVGRKVAKKGHEPACSGVVLYLGLRKRYEHLARDIDRAIKFMEAAGADFDDLRWFALPACSLA